MVYELPHILVPGAPTTDRYQRRGGGGGERKIREIPDRGAHAGALRESLTQAIETAQGARGQWSEELKAEGVILSVTGWPDGFELALNSIDLRRSGIELFSVKPPIDDPPSTEVATIFVPDSKVGQFFTRLDQYASQDTPTGTPRHEKLVTNIAAIQQATLEQLWTDHRPYSLSKLNGLFKTIRWPTTSGYRHFKSLAMDQRRS